MINYFSLKYGFNRHYYFLLFRQCRFLDDRLFIGQRHRNIERLFRYHIKVILYFLRNFFFHWSNQCHWWLMHKRHWRRQLSRNVWWNRRYSL